jgi:hypothetical protein
MAVKPAVKNAFDFIGKSPFFCFHNNKHHNSIIFYRLFYVFCNFYHNILF